MKIINVSNALEVIIQLATNILLIVILTLVFAEAAMRYAFGKSYGFMEEFSKWSQIWMAYLLLGVIEKTRGHIKVDMLYTRLSKKYKSLLLILFDLITLLFCILLFWSGIETAKNWRILGYIASIEFSVPMWIVMLSAPLGAVFLAFFGVHNLTVDIKDFNAFRAKLNTTEHRTVN